MLPLQEEKRSAPENAGHMTALDPSPIPLTITLFGPMQVQVEGSPLPRLRSRNGLWLLALLTLRGGRPMERVWLAGVLWPDIDRAPAAARLRVALSDLRRALGSQADRLQPSGRHALSLNLDGAVVDVGEFDAAISAGESVTLERAVTLYTGPLLEGCAEEWVEQDRGAREQDFLQALQTLAGVALASGDVETAADYYRRAVSLDPWREAAQRGLMQALSQTGDANAAIGVYQTFVRLLRKDDPKAAPEEATTVLYARLRTDARRRASAPAAPPAEKAVAPAVTGYLPHSLTDLVGRKEESEEIGELLNRSRLVTLTGPGGIGKTRLAVAVATEAVSHYSDGAWFVSLEALSDGKQIAPQIAGVLGLREEAGRTPQDGLTDHLREKRLLLVLDNCEHLLGAGAKIAQHLLGECHRVCILATSREALGIPEELAWAVPALAIPEPASLPAGAATLVRVLAGYDGVQLFMERAQTAQKDFRLTGDNAPALAQVCARLEGIPLALELAAARVRAMTLPQMAARLDDSLGLLTGGSRIAQSRQQTLRATLDWSYGLLTDHEQTLMGRLSIFSGGWDVEAAKGVCVGDGIEKDQIPAMLTSLTEKSLLVLEGSDSAGRYRMLEMVQQYAAERLQAIGMAELMRTRHLDWFADLAVAAYDGMRGPKQVYWTNRAEKEHGNFRSILAWNDAGSGEACLQIAGSLWWFWYIRGYLSEGKQLLEDVLRRKETQEPSRRRAVALNGLGTLCAVIGDFDAAQSHFEECLRIFQTLGDTGAIASALGNLGNVAIAQGEYELARDRYTESLEITREIGQPQRTAASLGNLGYVALALGDHPVSRTMNTEALGIFRSLQDKQGIARTLDGLGDAAHHQGDDAEAQAFYEEALTLFRELQEPRGICDAVSSLGDIALQRGHFDNAAALYGESLNMRRDTGLKEGIENSLREFAGLLLLQGEPRKATRLWATAEAMRDAAGTKLFPVTERLLESNTAKARLALGGSTFAAAWKEGHAFTWEQATAYALESA